MWFLLRKVELNVSRFQVDVDENDVEVFDVNDDVDVYNDYSFFLIFIFKGVNV